MISEEQERRITESKFWKPEKGKQYSVIMRNWRVESREFVSKITKEKYSKDTLVLDVVSVDAIVQLPLKEFSTTSQNTCKLLMAAIRTAERRGLDRIRLIIHRVDETTYNIADLDLVQSLTSGVSS